MHFFSVQSVVDDLRDDVVTDVQASRYLMAVATLEAIGHGVSLFTQSGPVGIVWAIPSTILAILFAVMTIYESFNANREGDGRDFFRRFVCLSLPVSMMLALASVGLSFTFNGIGYVLDVLGLTLSQGDGSFIGLVLIVVPVGIGRILWMRKSFRKASGAA